MNNHQIHRLTGPDRVRKRPAVLFGADDITGVQQAVLHLLEIFAAEAMLGHCTRLSVVQRGTELEISGNDRGLYLGQDTGDDRVWQALFCEIYPAPACPPDHGERTLSLCALPHHTLYGDPQPADPLFLPEEAGCFELYITQCACRYMDVSVCRGGILSTLRFRRGLCAAGICHTPTIEPNGTCFRFQPDEEVFRQTRIPAAFFLEALENFAMLCPGLQCSFTDSEGRHTVFLYEKGIADYVCKHSPLPPYSSTLRATGNLRGSQTVYEACVQVAIAYTPGGGSAKCLHNFRPLTCGGAHYRQLQRQLFLTFRDCFAPGLPDEPALMEALQKHFSVALVSWCDPHCSRWESGARQSIGNRLITELTCNAVGDAFAQYVRTHQEQLRPLWETVAAEKLSDHKYNI